MRNEGLAPGQRAVVLVSLLALGTAVQASIQPLDVAAVGERLLAGQRGRQGTLAVRGRLEERFGAVPTEPGRLPVRLEVLVPLGGEEPRRFRVSVVLAAVEGEPEVWQQERTVAASAGERRWLLAAALEVSEDFAEAALVVEDLADGKWGATRVELGGVPLVSAAAGDVLVEELADPAPAAAVTVRPAPLVRLVPPKRRPVSGRVRLHALTSSDEAARVVFVLDGTEVAADDREPYSQVVDLGPTPEPLELAVVAFAADGTELGRDVRRVNAPGQPFDVAVTTAERGGRTLAVAEVAVPVERRLEAVELYRNEALLATLVAPPFEAALPAGEASPTDYVRAVARLDDGASLDDVALLAGEGMGERLEVNLVQVFAVVTDRSGAPVRDLAAEDFALRRGGAGPSREVSIERFAHADDLPLSLGLVFDSSESMWALMPDAKQAGASFLARALRPGDRAFLVDFDTRPRLAQATTGDVREVLMAFGRLEAGGNTALYDAILFAMLQFESGPGRKALVVLTDGEDYGSRLSGSRCAELGRASGVPVYIVDLSGIQDPTRAVPKLELEAVAHPTGGRVYITTDVARLAAVYDEIVSELRSQYLLAFSTDRALSAEELSGIDVEVRGRGLRVRRVVGAASG